jgi:death-on-curing protein
MTTLFFVDEDVAMAIHDLQLAEHGGLQGVRDRGLLSSALARPRNAAAYGENDLAVLAAMLAFGIARNHPFIDGNKRTAFVVMQLFLRLNGQRMAVDHVDATVTFLRLASGDLPEEALCGWIRRHLVAWTAQA